MTPTKELPLTEKPGDDLGYSGLPLCREPWESYYILRRGIMPCTHGNPVISPMTAWEETWNSHKLQEIRSLGLQHFSFPAQTWATILFDAAAAYNRMSSQERPALLDSLLPLYLGKVLSFVKKTERMSLQQAEEYIESECTVFEENKPYIVKVWK